MVGILDQSQYHRIAGEVLNQQRRMCPRDVDILHPLQNMHGAMGANGPAKNEMLAAFLNQFARNRIGPIRIRRRQEAAPFLFDLLAQVRREMIPDQSFGHVGRRGR